MIKQNQKPSRKINILIVDTHEVFRIGLKQLLKNIKRVKNCIEADSVTSAMKMIHQGIPELILMELAQERFNGADLMRQIAKIPIKTRPDIMILSDMDEKIYAERAHRAGARGYLMKSEKSKSILDAISAILDGELYFSHSICERITLRKTRRKRTRSTIDRLSNREFEVLRMTGEGIRPRVIASELGLSVRTVETYFCRIKQKLDLKNAADLGRFAVKWRHHN